MKRPRDDMNRRQFIGTGAAAMAGAAILPPFEEAPVSPGPVKRRNDGDLVYRTLGKTGIELPVICLGSRQDTGLYNLILDIAPSIIFTAQFYQNGNHERRVGEALKNRKRDSYVLATAVGIGSDKDGHILEKDASQLPSMFEASLPRLQVDHVDLLFVSFAKSRETMLNPELLSALKKLKKDGKTRFVGVATHENEAETIRAAADSKVFDVALAQYNFKHPQQEAIKDAFSYASKAGLGTLAMKAHAGRFWDKENQHPINVRAALKWAAEDGAVDSILYRIGSVDEIQPTLSVMKDLRLTPEEKEDLRLGDAAGFKGLFCPQCGECRSQCPSALDIPTLMRGYMYAYGYGQPAFAKETIEGVEIASTPCTACSECSVRCSMGFDVREKVLDIARLRDVPAEFLVG